jgi:hypothetical protein
VSIKIKTLDHREKRKNLELFNKKIRKTDENEVICYFDKKYRTNEKSGGTEKITRF